MKRTLKSKSRIPRRQARKRAGRWLLSVLMLAWIATIVLAWTKGRQHRNTLADKADPAPAHGMNDRPERRPRSSGSEMVAGDASIWRSLMPADATGWRQGMHALRPAGQTPEVRSQETAAGTGGVVSEPARQPGAREGTAAAPWQHWGLDDVNLVNFEVPILGDVIRRDGD